MFSRCCNSCIKSWKNDKISTKNNKEDSKEGQDYPSGKDDGKKN